MKTRWWLGILYCTMTRMEEVRRASGKPESELGAKTNATFRPVFRGSACAVWEEKTGCTFLFFRNLPLLLSPQCQIDF